ncbi:uncharacterized protein [Odocoileus virginianus]|uniref:Uncharacterized protein isoform X3 n=1 Tax=Odocoileus virginianus TaxID=9874 RepID=A0A6J0VWZ4_ODOVR
MTSADKLRRRATERSRGGSRSEQHRARPWGSADGLTEKGTHRVQPDRPASRRRGGGVEAAVGWGCRAPSRGALRRSKRVATGSRPPRHATGSHRQRPLAQGRSRGTQDADWPPRPPGEPLRVSRPPPPTPKVAASAGEGSQCAYLRPHAPHAQPGVPAFPALNRGPSARGRHRRRRPRDDIQKDHCRQTRWMPTIKPQ